MGLRRYWKEGKMGCVDRRVMMVHLCTERRRWGTQTRAPTSPTLTRGACEGGTITVWTRVVKGVRQVDHFAVSYWTCEAQGSGW